MSSIIKFSVEELRQLAASGTACVEERRVTQSLALQPWCLANLQESIKNLLDYKIGKFSKDYDGILLSYKNLRILQNVGAIRNDHTDIHFQVQADYFIFRPTMGATLRGTVNHKSITHLGIIVHRVFNVVIPRPTEEPGARWAGARVREGQEVVFKIVMLDLFGALPYIRGELDERFLEVGADGDEEPLDNCIDKVVVSHVNFDKTRPSVQRQFGDCPEDVKVRPSPSKTPTRTKQSVSNGSERSPNNERVREKKKPKRTRLSTDGNAVEPPGSNSRVRQHKKHKHLDT